MCTVCKLISILNVWMLCYTGNVQTFTTPHSIYYTLEIWGASGNFADSNGGFGGYAFGYKYLSAGVNIYIYVTDKQVIMLILHIIKKHIMEAVLGNNQVEDVLIQQPQIGENYTIISTIKMKYLLSLVAEEVQTMILEQEVMVEELQVQTRVSQNIIILEDQAELKQQVGLGIIMVLLDAVEIHM